MNFLPDPTTLEVRPDRRRIIAERARGGKNDAVPAWFFETGETRPARRGWASLDEHALSEVAPTARDR